MTAAIFTLRIRLLGSMLFFPFLIHSGRGTNVENFVLVLVVHTHPFLERSIHSWTSQREAPLWEQNRKTVITELNLGNGNRPGREQLLVIIFTQQLLVWEMLWIQIRIIFRPLCHSGLLYMEKIYAFKGKTQSNPRIICLQAKVFVL